ncbi:Vsp/OspC family lipoprotein (plasmid) [Borrelia sp. CA_690]|uniref:Cell surface protein n=1 Tax=Borrelia maritima TaxID=2761123 RepID=A0A5J6WCQ3_9SPIR|nr:MULTISPECIES: Vsp/OspC family lipoprotein [Borrelia]QFI15053.1 cell surface protein [Borrelia maritima]WKC83919.1 Vsp/OspC family lipoprotein [Borrelia sp. CA_690]
MKKNTLSAVLMTLFLFISCNNSGKDGSSASTNPASESAKGPNLAEISKKIMDSNAVVLVVQEVEALLSSIDELAKAIGKKLDQNGLDTEDDHNGSLLAGAYTISALITQKLNGLKNEELKEKIAKAKDCSEQFTNKLKGSHAQLGMENASNDDAKKAIVKTNTPNDKGAKELKELSESVGTLAKAAHETLTNAIKELTSPVVVENPKKP